MTPPYAPRVSTLYTQMIASGAASSSTRQMRVGSRNQKRSFILWKHHLVGAAPTGVDRFARLKNLLRARDLRDRFFATGQPHMHLQAVAEKHGTQHGRLPMRIARRRRARQPQRLRTQ